MLGVVHKYVHAFKDMKVCSVKADRTRKFESYVKQLNWYVTEKIDPKVLASIPTDTSDPVDLYYFELGDYMGPYSVEEAGNKLVLRGIKADPLAHIAFVVDRPYLLEFGDWSTTSIWQDKDGHWCNLTIKAVPDDNGWTPEVAMYREDDGRHPYSRHCCSKQLYLGVRA